MRNRPAECKKETAIIIKKSNRTVEFHREKIKCKLGVYCVSELRVKVLESSEFNAIFEQGMNLILKTTNKFHFVTMNNIFFMKNKFHL